MTILPLLTIYEKLDCTELFLKSYSDNKETQAERRDNRFRLCSMSRNALGGLSPKDLEFYHSEKEI